MIWFTSDTHFYHQGIINFCNRPFSTVEEMNETIIKNWNSVVGINDTIYHLGDFSWSKDWSEIIYQLNGNITLIKGNHDKQINKSLFKGVYDLLEIKIEGNSITLCHFAMRVWNKSHFNSWHLFGHSHYTLPPEGKSFDIGMDTNNFYPYSFEDIKLLMINRPDNINYFDKNLKGVKNG